MLGLIVFCLLFGYFMAHIDHEYAEPMLKFWNGIFQIMMKMTEWIMAFAPIGVFGLVAKVVAKTGFEAAGSLLIFSLCVLAALSIHAFVTLPLLLKVVARVSPQQLLSLIHI